jgi:hypothetical protein
MNKTIFSLITLLFSMSISAATFNFAGYADSNLKDDNNTSFSEGVFTSSTEDGITLNVSGTSFYNNTWNNAFGYLDAGHAGLGLCKTRNCAGKTDDNVNDGEKLVLDFGQVVTLGETTFKNKDHGANFGGNIELSVDGVFASTLNLNLANILDLSAFTGQVFEFYNLIADKGTDDFYINTMNVSAVPIPAAAFLFAPALIGFMGLRRKTNVSAA